MIIILSTAILLLLLLVNWIRLVNNRNKINLPGPFPLPLLGNVHLFLSDTSEYLQLLGKFNKNYGDAFLVHFFSTPYVVLFHPKYMEPLLSSTELIIKGRSYRYLYPWLGRGLLNSTGLLWKNHRKFLTPAFHFNILQVFLPIFCKNQKILVEKLRRIPKGSQIDLFPIVALAALDNVTESIMGVCIDAQKNDDSEYVKSIDLVSGISSTRMQLPILGEDAIFNLLPTKAKHDKAVKVLHTETNRVVEARRRELKETNMFSLSDSDDIGLKNRYAFLDLLLLAEVNGKKIDPKRVSDEVNTFMFAGHDTTTSAISWTLFALSKRRDVQEKIYAELQTIFGDNMDRDPTYQELNQMKYLDLVIKESMRLYAPVPFIERFIEKDCVVGDIQLIKNTSVLINIFQMHRHPELYENPLEFKPERFETPLNNPFDWLAFSAGPRNCIGQRFALMELKVTISGIIKNFIVLPSDIEPKICAELVLKSKNGIYVKLNQRN